MLLAGTPEFLVFTLVLMRMSGFIFLNPVLGRKNIPPSFKAGLALMLALTVYPQAGPAEEAVTSAIVYAVLLLKEFALGYLL